MDTELMSQGLMITAIGMGLVFAVIIFLWGVMALLMRLTSGREKPAQEDTQGEVPDLKSAPDDEQTGRQRRAAVAAVAVGLALASARKKTSGTRLDAQAGGLSPWQAFHRSRQTNPEQRRG